MIQTRKKPIVQAPETAPEKSLIFTGQAVDFQLTPEEAERVRRIFENIRDSLAQSGD
jgi:hypothetical protein